MTEFKGTKGEWTNHMNEYGHITSVRSVEANRTIFTSKVNNMIESNANMVLATHSPEMLDMLNHILFQVFWNGGQLNLKDKENIENLIKKATEV